MMNFVQRILTFNGIFIVIGVVGGLASTLSLFVNPSSQVSVKWIIFTVFAFLILVIFLLKLSNDLFSALRKSGGSSPDRQIKAIEIKAEEHILLVKSSSSFSIDEVVAINFMDGDFERRVAFGYVYNIQDSNSIIQIKIFKYARDSAASLKLMQAPKAGLSKIVVRKNISFTSLREMINEP